MYCTSCNSIFSSPLQIIADDRSSSTISTYSRPHHEDILNLVEASEFGCRICRDLSRQFIKSQITDRSYNAATSNSSDDSDEVSTEGSSSNDPDVVDESGSSDEGDMSDDDGSGSSDGGDTSDDAQGDVELDLRSNTQNEKQATRYYIRNAPDYYHVEFPTGVLQLVFLLLKTDGGLQESRLYFLIPADNNDEAICNKELAELAIECVEFGEQRRWQQVQDWIFRCSTTHSLCQTISQTAQRSYKLPTRFLYVPYGPLPVIPYFQIIDTTKFEASTLGTTYVTFSHVWGMNQNPDYRTTRANLPLRMDKGISWNHLPSTFQDAIATTRRLHIPFLWIDALCIIQDDNMDWLSESDNMAETYKHAYLNLAATSSQSSKESLLHSLGPYPVLGTPTPTSWNENPHRYKILHGDFWQDRIGHTAITSRGWTLQERLLSPRILHFCHDTLAWECCELSASEAWPNGLLFQNSSNTSKGMKEDFHFDTSWMLQRYTDMKIDTKDRFYRLWSCLVGEYSKMEFTHPDKDKVVAISGLAKEVQQHIGADQYVAGMWRSRIYTSLLWKVIDKYQWRFRTEANGYSGDTSSNRAKSYRAPSWSWLSIDGLIEPSHYGDDWGVPVSGWYFSVTPRAEILRAEVDLKDLKCPEGDIQGGRLVIKGRLYGLRHYEQDFWSSKDVVRLKSWKVEVEIDADERLSDEIRDESFFLPIVLKSSVASLARTPGLTVSKDPKAMVVGLVLCPELNDVRRFYRRVGISEIEREYLDRIDRGAKLVAWEDEEAAERCEKVFTPDMALNRGDVVAGIFEIV